MLNLTQHNATKDQIEDGVVEPHRKADIQTALTISADEFSYAYIEAVTTDLVTMARTEIMRANLDNRVMIGGHPLIIGPLARKLLNCGIIPFHSISNRVSKEIHQPDGSVKKINVFKHVGFQQHVL